MFTHFHTRLHCVPLADQFTDTEANAYFQVRMPKAIIALLTVHAIRHALVPLKEISDEIPEK